VIAQLDANVSAVPLFFVREGSAAYCPSRFLLG
jgi:hypothetical protein